MVAIVITMCVRPEKDQELLVTLHELESLNRQATGYVGTTVHRDPEEKQVITLCEQWQTRKDLEHYMQSHAFEVLRGAIKVLTSSAEIEILSEDQIPGHQDLDEKGMDVLSDIYSNMLGMFQ